MKRQEIPILRDNEIPSAQSYNALAAPIRNIKSLTPETLRITQNPSNGGLQFEVPPYARQAATGSSDEEKTPVVLNCSFAISVSGRSSETREVTIAGGRVFPNAFDTNDSITVRTDSFTKNASDGTNYYYLHISTDKEGNKISLYACFSKSNTEITKSVRGFYILLGTVDKNFNVIQCQMGDVYLSAYYRFPNIPTAYIDNNILYLACLNPFATAKAINCLVYFNGVKIGTISWSGNYEVKANYGVYVTLSAGGGFGYLSALQYLAQSGAVDTEKKIYIPLVLLDDSGDISYITPQYINLGGRWI